MAELSNDSSRRRASGLVNDLIGIIATYATFNATVTLLGLSPEFVMPAYQRNGLMWRNKAQVETRGLTLDPSVIPDWLLYYQMVDTNHYGDLVSPYSDASTRGVYKFLVYGRTDAVVAMRSPSGGTRITLPFGRFSVNWSVRAWNDIGNNRIFVLDDRGVGHTISLNAAGGDWVLDPVVVFLHEVVNAWRDSDEAIYWIDRSGQIHYYSLSGESDHPKLPSTGAVWMIMRGLYHGYIDRFGKPHGSDNHYVNFAKQGISEPIVKYSTDETAFDRILTVSGKLLTGLKVLNLLKTSIRFIASDVVAGNERQLVPILSADRRLYFLDHAERYPREGYYTTIKGLITLVDHDQYAGRIQRFDSGFLLVG